MLGIDKSDIVENVAIFHNLNKQATLTSSRT